MQLFIVTVHLFIQYHPLKLQYVSAERKEKPQDCLAESLLFFFAFQEECHSG